MRINKPCMSPHSIDLSTAVEKMKSINITIVL